VHVTHHIGPYIDLVKTLDLKVSPTSFSMLLEVLYFSFKWYLTLVVLLNVIFQFLRGPTWDGTVHIKCITGPVGGP